MSVRPAGALERVRLARPDDVDGWRTAARAQLAAGVPPEAIVWEVAGGTDPQDLFATGPAASTVPPETAPSTSAGADSRPRLRVPREFLDLAERAACHRDPQRFALLYRVLWRCAHGDPTLLRRPSDPDVHRLYRLAKAVARERHKMHAFMRFRQTSGVEPEHFHAWFEPEHHTLKLASGFFVRRFATMRWSIVTPELSAHWDTRELVFAAGGTRGQRPEPEVMETLWRTYYASIFNPARLKLDAMRAEMPVKYWKNLPEAELIADLVHGAGRRTASMIAAAPSTAPRFAARAMHPTAASVLAAAPTGVMASEAGVHASASEDDDRDGGVPERFVDLAALRLATARCSVCEHACHTTQAVDGEGRVGAPLMLVGEQPGDREDLEGRPFAGPAGSLLRAVLDELEVPDDEVFLTNATRHFHHEPRAKQRLHRTPTAEHVQRCRPFLFEEIRLVRPRVIVALGATAAEALLGRKVRVGVVRGKPFTFGDGMTLVPSAHPATILRARGAAARRAARAALVADLERARQIIGLLS